MTALAIARELRAWKFRVTSERELQEAIGDVLRAAGLEFEREVVLGAGDRIDFLVGDVGIETKVGGTARGVLRQLRRYAGCERVRELVLVTNRARHRTLPELIDGKPLIVVSLEAQL